MPGGRSRGCSSHTHRRATGLARTRQQGTANITLALVASPPSRRGLETGTDAAARTWVGQADVTRRTPPGVGLRGARTGRPGAASWSSAHGSVPPATRCRRPGDRQSDTQHRTGVSAGPQDREVARPACPPAKRDLRSCEPTPPSSPRPPGPGRRAHPGPGPRSPKGKGGDALGTPCVLPSPPRLAPRRPLAPRPGPHRPHHPRLVSVHPRPARRRLPGGLPGSSGRSSSVKPNGADPSGATAWHPSAAGAARPPAVEARVTGTAAPTVTARRGGPTCPMST